MLMLVEPSQETVIDRLPSNRAFVVQFTSQANIHDSTVFGRAEHIASGAVLHFESLEQLLEFVAKALSAET